MDIVEPLDKLGWLLLLSDLLDVPTAGVVDGLQDEAVVAVEDTDLLNIPTVLALPHDDLAVLVGLAVPGTAVREDVGSPGPEDALILLTHVAVTSVLQALASPVPAACLAVAVPVGLRLQVHGVVRAEGEGTLQEQEELQHAPSNNVSFEGHYSYQSDWGSKSFLYPSITKAGDLYHFLCLIIIQLMSLYYQN